LDILALGQVAYPLSLLCSIFRYLSSDLDVLIRSKIHGLDFGDGLAIGDQKPLVVHAEVCMKYLRQCTPSGTSEAVSLCIIKVVRVFPQMLGASYAEATSFLNRGAYHDSVVVSNQPQRDL
jgi:hypothetical protein